MGRVGAWLGLAIIVLVIIAGLGTVTTSAQDTAIPPSHLEPHTNTDAATVIKATFLSVDPARGEVEARLEFLPSAALVSDEILTTSLTLQVNSVDKAGSLIQFPKNRPMDAIIVRFPILEGALNDYPLDHYKAEITAYLIQDDNDLPVQLNSVANIPGFELELTPSSRTITTAIDYDLSINRANSVLFFAFFLMILMWVLSLMALWTAWGHWQRHEAPNPTILNLHAALLFAFPAVRNSQPGVPPVGTWGDFVSFFWAESMIALALGMLWFCFLRYSAPIPKISK